MLSAVSTTENAHFIVSIKKKISTEGKAEYICLQYLYLNLEGFLPRKLSSETPWILLPS